MSHDSPPAVVPSRKTVDGLQFFRLMAEGKVKPPALVSLLGLRLIEADRGRVVFAGTVTDQHYNGLGVAHGGYAATMLDSALGCAINTTQPAGRLFTTLELKINYTRPMTRDTGEVRCEATVLHVGSRTATAEARIVDAEGRLYAHATTTCIVVS
jgi:uncharacterized protein (TIGR00369 family)